MFKCSLKFISFRSNTLVFMFLEFLLKFDVVLHSLLLKCTSIDNLYFLFDKPNCDFEKIMLAFLVFVVFIFQLYFMDFREIVQITTSLLLRHLSLQLEVF